jgi:hypothetical protein
MKPSPGDIVRITQNAYDYDGVNFTIVALEGSVAEVLTSYMNWAGGIGKLYKATYCTIKFFNVPLVDYSSYREQIDCSVGGITSLEEKFLEVIGKRED